MVNYMTYSMTGFANLKGQHNDKNGSFSWVWDLRTVNARGLDIRLRVPDWISGLEPALRKAISAEAARGSISLSLKLGREADDAAQVLSPAGLEQALGILAQISQQAQAQGVVLAPSSAVEVAGLRGVLDGISGGVSGGAVAEDTGPLLAALVAQMPELLGALNQMRQSEGAALALVLVGQLDQVAALVEQAGIAADDRKDAQAENLRKNLARVLDNLDGVEESRLIQELALIATKSDIREEIDRLKGHVAAARLLLDGKGARGRKLDFLMQEFMREANTLCAKAQFQELTRIGLELKHVIDQMREQVQNVE